MNALYERWMRNTIFSETGCSRLSKKSLNTYQIKKIKDTIETAKKGRAYGAILKDIDSRSISSLNDVEKLPFTTSYDIMRNPYDFLSVPINEISRIVTLNTSGTSGDSKRIFFTENDIKATIEFFEYGMLNIVSKGQRVLILMSGSTPQSIGQLLSTGLKLAGCDAVIYGPVCDVYDVLKTIKSEHIDCIVAIPIQAYYIGKLKNLYPEYKDIKLKSILLSADYVPRSICSFLGSSFDCPVYTHYGMTEMGYGGGVECSALNGYHMRETDLYVEIINPLTGKNTKEGEYGEVVFTTLRRCGMPLIRYRTGDIARFLPKKCSCSNTLRRMDYVKGRFSDFYRLCDGSLISIGMLDEVMFKISSVLDFTAVFERGRKPVLKINIKPANSETEIDFGIIKSALMNDENLGTAIENNKIILETDYMYDDFEISSGAAKRKLKII